MKRGGRDIERVEYLVPERPLLHACCNLDAFGDCRVDIDPSVKPDVVADITKPLPFKTDEFAAWVADMPWTAAFKPSVSNAMKSLMRVAPVGYVLSPWTYGAKWIKLTEVKVMWPPGVNQALLFARYEREDPAAGADGEGRAKVTARGIDLKSLTRKSKKGDWSFFKDKPTSRSDRRRIINEAWVLPRPRKTKYKGGFPLHFEKKIIRRMGLTPNDLILHPFGGAAEYGLRFDIRRETRPDIQCDAHFLPVRDRALDGVILDPPYDDALAETLYDTAKLRPLKYSQFVREAVRVLKPGGMLVVYHYVTTPRVDGTDLIRRVFLETRAWHRLRSVKIHRKHGVNSTVQGRLMEEAKA